MFAARAANCRGGPPWRPDRCTSFFGDSKPLESFGRISVHRHDFDLVESDHGIVAGESFDPLRIVVTHSDAFRKIENSVVSIFLFVPRVPRKISFVCL